MVMVLARAFSVGTVGAILALLFAALAQKFSPNEHLLILQGQDADHLIAYGSAFLGCGFGGVIGAIWAAADLIAAAVKHNGAVAPPPPRRPGQGGP